MAGYEPIPQGWTWGAVPFGVSIDGRDDERDIPVTVLGSGRWAGGQSCSSTGPPQAGGRDRWGLAGLGRAQGQVPPWAAAAPCGRTGRGDQLPRKGLGNPRAPQTQRRQQWRPSTSQVVMAREQPAGRGQGLLPSTPRWRELSGWWGQAGLASAGGHCSSVVGPVGNSGWLRLGRGRSEERLSMGFTQPREEAEKGRPYCGLRLPDRVGREDGARLLSEQEAQAAARDVLLQWREKPFT